MLPGKFMVVQSHRNTCNFGVCKLCHIALQYRHLIKKSDCIRPHTIDNILGNLLPTTLQQQKQPPTCIFVEASIMSTGHNTKGGSNGHFNHADSTKVNVSTLLQKPPSYNDTVTSQMKKSTSIVQAFKLLPRHPLFNPYMVHKHGW